MPPDTPLNKAHQHASNAEDYTYQGLFIPAAEEHYKSAEAFLLCVDQASDEGTKRTLRMLYNEHNKAAKELQRRIAKLRDEGKDPSLPQRSPAPHHERTYTTPLPSGSHSIAPHVALRGRMGDSNHTIDDSYMVLGQQSDPMDTFNQFWKNLEGMLDNLSQPVAFATAPLARGPSRSRQGPISWTNASPSDKSIRQEWSMDNDEPYYDARSEHDGKMLGLECPRQEQHTASTAAQKQILRVSVESPTKVLSDASDVEEVMADEDSPSGESFFMIPSTNKPSLATNLQKENDSLKIQLASLRERLEIAERMRMEQEEQLRERISCARREAQRVKNSGFLPQRPAPPSLDLNTLSINVPALPAFPQLNANRDRDAQLTGRIRELESEVRDMRLENEKQKAMITKFRERWEKLKESAKRKRNAKANLGADTDVREQRIDEEPEAEVAAEDGDSSNHAG